MRFPTDNLQALAEAEIEEPDSEPIATTFEELKDAFEKWSMQNSWASQFTWQDSSESPYVGPENPGSSRYIWFGAAHQEHVQDMRPTTGLQFEFGIDTSETKGFFDLEVLCGIYAGPWINKITKETIHSAIEDNPGDIAEFLSGNLAYKLQTVGQAWREPSAEELTENIETVLNGFTITRRLSLDDIVHEDPYELLTETFRDTAHLYALLAGVNEPSIEPGETWNIPRPDTTTINSGGGRTESSSVGFDSPAAVNSVEPVLDEIESHSSFLDPDDIESTRENLEERGASPSEALEIIRDYAVGMEADEGLFAVSGLGPQTGYELQQFGIDSLEELVDYDAHSLATRIDLPQNSVQRILTDARDQISEADANIKSPSTAKPESGVRTKRDSNSGEDLDRSEVAESTGKKSIGSGTPADAQTDVVPNAVTEYYESLRSIQHVLDIALKTAGTGLKADDPESPVVHYQLLIYTILNSGDADLRFTALGAQQEKRLEFTAKAYREEFGDGDWVTNYQVIDGEMFAPQTRAWLAQQVDGPSSHGFLRPIPPGTTTPLPEIVETPEELRTAISLLESLPARPDLPTEDVSHDQALPAGGLYMKMCEKLEIEPLINVSDPPSVSRVTDQDVNGPVVEATPDSESERENFLTSHGKMTHLFKRVHPPEQSARTRSRPVFSLDWYRPPSDSFDELYRIAKEDDMGATAAFESRLRDLVTRRFLRDTWEYDYITVVPSHEVGALSEPLIELAKSAVTETPIEYKPLLERTQTTDKQREKMPEERAEAATDPAKSLAVTEPLDGEAVILFDDICTTGSTLLGCAHLLSEAGVSRVVGLTLGLTPGHGESPSEIYTIEARASEIIAGLES